MFAELTGTNEVFKRGVVKFEDNSQALPLEDVDFRQRLWDTLEQQNVIASE